MDGIFNKQKHKLSPLAQVNCISFWFVELYSFGVVIPLIFYLVGAFNSNCWASNELTDQKARAQSHNGLINLP